VVKGDLSTTDVFIEVVDPATPVFVSDVDGTLTTSETEEFTDLLIGQLPDANPSAAEALSTLAAKGVRPFYLTARPEWLTQRTRDFLTLHGFPAGIVHTTLSGVGALGGQAVGYKTGELDWLASKGMSPMVAFGNTASDGEAYDNAAVQPLANRIFFQFDDSFGGRRIESYAELLGELGALPSCL
jgi:phosphatidate phosphatase PAH1